MSPLVGTCYHMCCILFAGIFHKVSSVDRKLAGIAFLFKLLGYEDFTKSFEVRQALKGYHKGQRSNDSCCPVSFEVLSSVLDSLDRVCTLRWFYSGRPFWWLSLGHFV